MKKLVSILTLVLALCMVMPMAFAEEPTTSESQFTVNYDDMTFWQNGEFVHFPLQTGTINGKNFIQFKFYTADPVYAEVKDLTITSETTEKDGKKVTTYKVLDKDGKEVGKLVDSKDCTTANWIELSPINAGTANIKTNNADDTARYDKELDKKLDGYYGISDEQAKTMTKKVTLDDLKKVKGESFKKGDATYDALAPHDHSFTKFEVIEQASCTEAGSVVPVCELCGKKDEAVVTGMSHKSYLTDDELQRLLALNGEEKATDRTVKTAATDSKGNAYEYTITKPATCAGDGEYEGICKNCGKKVTFTFKAEEVTKAAGELVHEWGAWQIDIAATCETRGQRFRVCSACLKEKEYEFTEPTGHKWVPTNVTKEGTCVEEGLAGSMTCENCKKVVKAADVEKTKLLYDVKNNKTFKDAWADTSKDGIKGSDGKSFKIPADPKNHPSKYWKLAPYQGADAPKTSEDAPETSESFFSVKATCETDGKHVYVCGLCGKIANEATVKATGHDLYKVYRVVFEDGSIYDGNDHKGLTAPSCKTKDGKQGKNEVATYCKNGCDKYAKEYSANDTTTKWTQVDTPKHVFTEGWTCRLEPVAEGEKKTAGVWFRICSVCSYYDEYIGFTAPTDDVKTEEPKTEEPKTEEPKTEEPKTSEDVKDGWYTENGKTSFYKDGKIDTTMTGVVDYNGGKFFCTEGTLDTDAQGANLYDGTWYFLSNGQVQEQFTGFAEYDGAWFVVEKGIINTSFNGLYDYNGGKFVVAAGKLQSGVNGLWQDTANNEWVFCSQGQVQTQWTGVAEYNGSFFVLKDGKLDSKDGTVEYDGETFIVSKGQLYPMTAAEEPKADEPATSETAA